MTASVVRPVHLLGNGRLHTFLAAGGTGGTTWQGAALTRWAAAPVGEPEGLLLYLRDLEAGALVATGLAPFHGAGAPGAAAPGGVLFETVADGLCLRVEVTVAPDRDLELRRIRLRNDGRLTRHLDLTTAFEVVLNDPAADRAHPAFSKLFVQTERDPGGALLARRRPRSPDEPALWLAQQLWCDGRPAPAWETDRARFLGRGRTAAAPAMLEAGTTLSGTTGNVLDPVFAQRHTFTLAPGQAVELMSALAAGADRAQVLALTSSAVAGQFEPLFRAAQAEALATLQRLGLPREWRARLPVLTGALAYGACEPRPGLPLPARQELPAGGLGVLGLTGGLPVVAVHVRTPADVMTAVGLARVAAYWRTRGVGVDLVLLDASGPGLADAVHQVGPSPSPRLGRTIVHRGATEAAAVVARLERLARFVVRDGTLPALAPAPPVAARFRQAPPEATGALPADEPLRHWNAHGGFSADGSEYVIRLPADGARQVRPPLAWTNVLANEHFGALATEAGGGYTWSRNSREHRLTPWTNDPIGDPPSEALFLTDLDLGLYWSPLPAPAGGGADVEVRHGFGHTSWRRRSQGLTQHVTAFVPREAPLKVVHLRVTNDGTHPRRLALTTYQALVLGAQEQDTRRAVGTAWDAASGAVLAMNPDAGEFASGVTFAALVTPEGGTAVEHTAHRGAFLGNAGTLAAPEAVVTGAALDGRTGRGLDPCAAFRTTFTLAPGETAEATLLLGEAPDAAAARSLITRFRAPAVVAMELADVGRFWRRMLGRLRVETPVPELDLMLNGWLAYQNLACRVWGRSAFYQSGGAFGFRDQLQDAAALIWLDPALTRRQLLLHAAHQFEEGDVLHWWHPPLGKGIRTRFSDDLLWLPLLTAEYARHTGDTAVLDEPVRFLRAPQLEHGEDETFLVPTEAGRSGTLYEHCCLALDRSLTRGAHGIPLMGTGDWNDGMNRVGRLGQGESVWLGFFLYHILEGFLPYCEARRDAPRLARYRAYRAALGQALNADGWDGGWYRRAWYDDGAVLGSRESDECRIDTIAQAWAVISGAAPPERAATALEAMEQHLVAEPEGIIRLLTPAFDQTPHDPGYIKGYLPGVRENGGQYTHGALWGVRALAELGRRDRAARLLRMLSPVHHGGTAAGIARYQVEPYVVAADVYGVAPHTGRGGWTWYTGSAGWMFRVGVESLLGITVLDGTVLRLAPCIPAEWPGFRLQWCVPGSDRDVLLTVEQRRDGGPTEAFANGERLVPAEGALLIPLAGGGGPLDVQVRLGPDVGPRYRAR